MQLLTQLIPLLAKFGFDLSDTSLDEFKHALPSFYRYLDESEMPSMKPIKSFLPMLDAMIAPLTSQKVCYADHGCFANYENGFECLRGALPVDPKLSTFHLRRYLSLDDDAFDIVPLRPQPSFWQGFDSLTIVVHGWRTSSSNWNNIKENSSHMVLALDWRDEASSLHFLESAQNGRLIARSVVADFLVDSGIAPSRMHLIGHSLGAHVAAFIAKEAHVALGTKIGRVTGLDPAGPFFENCQAEARLDITDAELVDVIHTDPGQLPHHGIDIPIGHFDYFIAPPKWCNRPKCAHSLAPKFFQMTRDKQFWTKDCANLIKYTGQTVGDKYRPKISHMVELDYTNFEACFFKNIKSQFLHQLGI